MAVASSPFGAVELQGKVKSFTKFGALIKADVGGEEVDVFLHVSRIKETYVEKASDELEVGQDVSVRLQKFPTDRKPRYEVTMKPMTGKKLSEFSSGESVSGEVADMSKRFAWVDVGAVAQAAIPRDEAESEEDFKKRYPKGMSLTTTIAEVRPEAGRLVLNPPEA